MAKHDPPSDSEPEEIDSPESSSSGGGEEGEEEEENTIGNVEKRGISDYEKQRLSRIAENKARLEALGLRKMACSFMGSLQKSTPHKGKRKIVDDDEDYKPNADDSGDDDYDDEDFVGGQSSSKSARNKAKNKGSKPKKIPLQSADFINEADDELMQAIALSLQDSAKDETVKESKGNAHVQEDAGRRKRKKAFTSCVQMTEDELILHFFQFDESGQGTITIRDLRRVARDHDFTWTDKELADMICCFDTDGDAKLNLDDFRKIVCRCHMIQRSEKS